jgi:hypothetical protein
MMSATGLATWKAVALRAMPDTATILRPTTASTPGGFSQNFVPVGTTPCRLYASVLASGGEQISAAELASTMVYTMTMPPGTDVQPRDRVQVQGTTFEVIAIKGASSWNISDSATLKEIRR